ncbi:TRAP transporter solute receptor, TAXI family precursor [hydrothermal vent metagenome]|uniref:TRAP transporter solute receptor, TAXI family n=1 Tax=hydrothermal vent metagenome TaxID=652676 RepID=A0A3B1CCB8_9ZZZZ
MKRGTTFLLAIFLISSLQAGEALAKRIYVTIGAGAVTGVYFPTAGAIAKIVNKKRKQHGIRATVESTGGSTYNVNSMSLGELDMGLVQSDVGYRAYNGVGDFKGRKVGKLRSVLSLHAEPFHIVANESIKTFADLKGKRVNIGNPGSGQRSSAEALFTVTPFGLGDIIVEGLKASEAPDFMADGRIDAYFYTVGVGSANIMDVATSHKINIVAVDDDVVAKLKKGRPYYVSAEIPGGVYPNVDKPVKTFAVKATLLTTTDVPDDVVYNVVKTLFEDLETFKKTHPVLNNLTPAKMLEGLSAPLHPGAEKYYKERGWVK